VCSDFCPDSAPSLAAFFIVSHETISITPRNDVLVVVIIFGFGWFRWLTFLFFGLLGTPKLVYGTKLTLISFVVCRGRLEAFAKQII
jgi:hypothetical protein